MWTLFGRLLVSSRRRVSVSIRLIIAASLVVLMGAPVSHAQPFSDQNVLTTSADAAQSVVAADLNGDGALDVLSASSEDDKIAWYESEGGGAFSDQRVITQDADGAHSVRTSDVDGDGDQDVLSASYDGGTVSWYENNGGTFSGRRILATNVPSATSVFAADLTGDGDEDVLSASFEDDKIAWYENTGGDSFSDENVISTGAEATTSVYAAPLNGDGRVDVLAASSGTGEVVWYENTGNGTFANATVITTDAETVQSVRTADLDGDGDQDVLSASFGDDTVAWYENDGTGSFSDQKAITTDAAAAHDVHAADLDGDDDQDVLSASFEDDTIAWYENDGTGSFSDQKVITTSAEEALSVFAADLTSNGALDVLSASRGDNTIAWYENTGKAGAGSVLRVDQDVSSPGEGETWDAAYRHLQSALAKADTTSSVSEIWIAEGTYYPDGSDAVSDGRRDTSFALQDGLEIYGGFTGGEQERSGRNPEASPTVLSGNIGAEADSTDNSYHVVDGSGTGPSATLDGVVVEEGQADAISVGEDGGLTSETNGGGLFVDRGSPTVRNVLFRRNYARNGGGAALVDFGDGDAVGDTLTLADVRFLRNRAKSAGGGFFVREGVARLQRASVRGNAAKIFGGGVAADEASDVRAVSSLFAGNAAGSSGGGAGVREAGKLTLINATVVANEAPDGGGISAFRNGQANVYNSILWDNYATGSGRDQILISSTSGADYASSNIKGAVLEDSSANLNEYPGFRTPISPRSAPTVEGDFRLQNISPVVDQGDPSFLPEGAEEDLEGFPREQASVDIGAYEGFRRDVAVSPNQTIASEIVPETLTDQTSKTHVQIEFSDEELNSPISEASPPERYRIFRIERSTLRFSEVATADPSSTESNSYVVTDSDIDVGTEYIYTVAGARADGTERFGGRSATRVQKVTRPAIYGRVTDEDTGDPLSSATVSVADNRVTAQTDRNGRYLLEDLQRRRVRYEVEASKAKYSPQTARLPTFISDQKFYELDFGLRKRGDAVPTELPDPFGSADTPSGEQEVQTVRRGGVAHRYYVIPLEEGEPIGGVEVQVKAVNAAGDIVKEVPGSPFETDNSGIVDIKIDTDSALPVPFDGPGSTRTFAITKAGGTEFEDPPRFSVKQKRRQLRKRWQGTLSGEGELSAGFATGQIKSIVQAEVNADGNTNKVALTLQGQLGKGVKEEVQPPIDVALSSSDENDIEAKASLSGLLEGRYSFPWPPSRRDAVAFLAQYGKGVDLGGFENRVHQLALENYDRSRLNDLQAGGASGVLAKAGAEANLDLAQFTGGAIRFGAQYGGNVVGQFEINASVGGGNVASIAPEARLKYNQSLSVGAGINVDFLNQRIEEGDFYGVGGSAEIRFQGFARPRIDVQGESLEPAGKLTLGYTLAGGANAVANFGALSIGESLGNPLFETATTFEFQGETLTPDGLKENVGEDLLAIDELDERVEGESLGISLNNGSIDELAQDLFTEVNENQKEEEIENLNVEDGVRYKKEGRFINLDREINPELDLSLSGEQVASAGVELGAGFQSQYRFRAVRGRLYRLRNYSTAKFDGPSEDPLTAGEVIGGAFEIAFNALKDVGDALFVTLKNIGGDVVDGVSGIAGSNADDTEKGEVDSSVQVAIGPGKSYLKVNRSSVPASVVEQKELRVLSWSFFGGSPTITESEARSKARRIALRKRYRLRRQEGLTYGIGGFYRFEPHMLRLRDSTSTLAIYYQDEEVQDIDETELALYRQADSGTRWKFIGGSVTPDSNKVSAQVRTLGTYTLAPRVPDGSFRLTPGSSSLPADGSSTTQVQSEVVTNNDGTQVPDGTFYTVNATLGSISSADEDPDQEGTQVSIQDGRLSFELEAGRYAGTAQISARSAESSRSRGRGQATFENASAPPAPEIETSYRNGEEVRLEWEGERPPDFNGFQIHYDTDDGAPPFEGLSSEDPASPINVGRSDSVRVVGLDPDSTYYFAVTARDNSGARSEFSNVARFEGRSESEDDRVGPNYPNPTSGQTTFTYRLEEKQRVRIEIYDTLGRRVATIMNRQRKKGRHQAQFDASRLASGIYFYRVDGEKFADEGKMVVVK